MHRGRGRKNPERGGKGGAGCRGARAPAAERDGCGRRVGDGKRRGWQALQRVEEQGRHGSESRTGELHKRRCPVKSLRAAGWDAPVHRGRAPAQLASNQQRVTGGWQKADRLPREGLRRAPECAREKLARPSSGVVVCGPPVRDVREGPLPGALLNARTRGVAAEHSHTTPHGANPPPHSDWTKKWTKKKKSRGALCLPRGVRPLGFVRVLADSVRHRLWWHVTPTGGARCGGHPNGVCAGWHTPARAQAVRTAGAVASPGPRASAGRFYLTVNRQILPLSTRQLGGQSAPWMRDTTRCFAPTRPAELHAPRVGVCFALDLPRRGKPCGAPPS